ncbi:DUF58 domain-containing protein [bacterium (Candidatus Blackallbacteria) CG17_big_fil_post_rev_8_21_14_2_50_48_46]|uniref:DUF58 domain-containing protein n=1 Tax=bacterium (Candidatus Blackallbacteria) CG17_big_fil_post_rev_8_21_14_2_50_48_46 TaxID=2014261 RepID=A0A2M7G1M0_9BACT|nr:MAG: DUF58 domain-containing protein [bacterium (Candidatus Blackallbacteria) CG18_big_fil_WC_8_21_14_2_50_49_26]PIW15604.1 MAG: DUF58 domain-containing protein [bacterium (Candidatus Blackallbacteria) CG17_big_fil_post_rev_8_21_14_2_50_48_46]PIW49395.1 MAG: DUF58 domain-containing protein [bacterium (Candidatus Blackallbacteria) CG13_big_fil_rev_8_21_14_2_50_49_14]
MSQVLPDAWKRIHHLEIKARHLVDHVLSGQYMSVFKGVGLEFDEVRPYQEGDDERQIDWNVTARTGHLHIKRFVEEREQSLFLVVDTSSSLFFGSQRHLKTDLMLEFCALMAFSAMRNNDRVGLLSFDEELKTFLPPKKGKKHALRILRELMVEPERRERKSDLSAALKFVNHILHRRGIVFILSDFIETGSLYPLKVLSQRHDCVAVMLQDPLDLALPKTGLVALRDPETQNQRIFDLGSSRVRLAYQEKMQAHFSGLRQEFRQMKIDQIVLPTESESLVTALLKFYRFHHH